MTPENTTAPTTYGALACPVCGNPLERYDRQFRCENNHQFDIARQGYVNLLQPQHKKSKEPGDSQEMVEARYRFLEQGYYEPISTELNTLIEKHVASTGDNNHYQIIDAGSGEGYYTHKLQQHLSVSPDKPGTPTPTTIMGFDISQRAIKAACRRSKLIQWLIATSSHIPVTSRSQDAVLCLFSRIVPEEFSRLLKDDGVLYIASTGTDHLIELRERLYQNVKQVAYNPGQALSGYFVPLDNQDNISLHYPIEVTSNQAINDLLMMTPHYWRATESAKSAIQAMESISVTVHVHLTGYRVCR